MKHYALFGAVALTFCSYSSYGDWYEATGQAVIERGNIENARQIATEDAIKRAALFAGASLSSSQRIVNGILQQEQFGYNTNGQLKKLQILSESQNNNIFTITIRADIEPQANECEPTHYKKPVLLSQIQLQARQDAIYGKLSSLGKDTSTQLSYHLRDYAPTALVQKLEQELPLNSVNNITSEHLFYQGNQYLISANINDLSLGNKTNRFWQNAEKERFFAIDVALFDLFEQTTIFQQEYRTSESWPYKDNSTPASHSQAFWQMPYGSKIDKLLEAIASDMQQQLECKALLSPIASVKQNEIMLNIGKLHGLEVGDELQIFQIKREANTPNIKRIIKSPITLTVTDLTERNTWATSTTQELLQHIQQGDVVSVRKNRK